LPEQDWFHLCLFPENEEQIFLKAWTRNRFRSLSAP
jgi:hypothetical protein